MGKRSVSASNRAEPAFSEFSAFISEARARRMADGFRTWKVWIGLLNERQSRPDRALGIVLVRLRIAEIHQHPVAHVFGHETIEPGDRLRDAFVIGADHRTQVFRVELGRE